MSFSIGMNDMRRTVVTKKDSKNNNESNEKIKLKRPDQPLYIPRNQRLNSCFTISTPSFHDDKAPMTLDILKDELLEVSVSPREETFKKSSFSNDLPDINVITNNSSSTRSDICSTSSHINDTTTDLYNDTTLNIAINPLTAPTYASNNSFHSPAGSFEGLMNNAQSCPDLPLRSPTKTNQLPFVSLEHKRVNPLSSQIRKHLNLSSDRLKYPSNSPYFYPDRHTTDNIFSIENDVCEKNSKIKNTKTKSIKNKMRRNSDKNLTDIYNSSTCTDKNNVEISPYDNRIEALNNANNNMNDAVDDITSTIKPLKNTTSNKKRDNSKKMSPKNKSRASPLLNAKMADLEMSSEVNYKQAHNSTNKNHCEKGKASYDNNTSHNNYSIENATNADNSGCGSDDDWFDKYDDSGNALQSAVYEELTSKVGEERLKNSKVHHFDYTPPDLHNDKHSHLLEIFDFPKESRTADLMIAFKNYHSEGFEVKWVDDTHALAVFSNSFAAHSAQCSFRHPLIRLRRVTEASRQTKLKLNGNSDFPLPHKERPTTVATVARNMLTGALGIKSQISKEKREQERKILQDAREKKKSVQKMRTDAWDGKF